MRISAYEIIIVTMALYGSVVITVNLIFVPEDKSTFNVVVKFVPSH